MKTDKKIEIREILLANVYNECFEDTELNIAVEELSELINTEVQKAVEEAHPTKDGYCCACDYDIAVMERKIKDAVEDGVRGYIEWFNNQDEIKENGIRLYEESAETYLQNLKDKE